MPKPHHLPKIDSMAPEGNPAVPQIQVMSPTPTTSTTRSRREARDTGFPEPFNSDRNTTLPHPDADLSPNATLTQEDIDPSRALSRTRRSFLRKNRRTLNSGRITPQSEALYSILSLANVDLSDTDSVRHVSPTTSSVRLSKETDSLASRNSMKDDETPPTSPDIPSHHHKRGLLRRLRQL